MRNLKKFLALVMAMVMAFSLMLTVNAKDVVTEFSDRDQADAAFTEAVDVLSGMKVFQGDPEGTFRPASTITRAEVAALIYRLATGDVDDARAGLYANYGNFADVAESDWFAGYVGYCANAGYIKGHGGYFNPYGQVTGYEVLAMVLRAAGYDKNHEFEGATWQTNVSALATQLQVLTDVKTTHYGNTLHLASRRDVVASLLFNTAYKVHMVEYTPIGGYNQYNNLLGEKLNPTLGKKYFGLAYTTRIILGNQATGEGGTLLGVNSVKYEDANGVEHTADTQYVYPGSTIYKTWLVPEAKPASGNVIIVPASEAVKLSAETGLDLFGHKVKAWYNEDDTATWKQTYAVLDKVELTNIVHTTDPDGDNSDTKLSDKDDTTKARLGVEAQKAGFSVNLKTSKAFMSDQFGRILGGTTYNRPAVAENKMATDAADATDSGADNNNIFLLISNNKDKTVDVVVSLEAEVGTIARQDTTSSVKSLRLSTPDATASSANSGKQTSTYTGYANSVAPINMLAGDLPLDSITKDSTTALGSKVVGWKIKGTADSDTYDGTDLYKGPAASNSKMPYFQLDNLPTTVTGTIQSVGSNNELTMSDGKVYEQSWFRFGFNPNGSNASDKVIGVDGTSGLSGETFPIPLKADYSLNLQAGVTYTIALDNQGRWLGLTQATDEFIYGTFADFEVGGLGTGSSKYALTGVNLNGEKVINREFTSMSLIDFSSNDTPSSRTVVAYPGGSRTLGDGYSNDDDFLVSQKIYGTTSDGNQVKRRANTGYMLSSDGHLDSRVSGPRLLNSGVMTIRASDVSNGFASYNGGQLLATPNTKFIVVSGMGTDTLDVKTYNGISEFLNGSSWVTINGTVSATSGKVGLAGTNEPGVAKSHTYYVTEADRFNKWDTTANKQLDTVIMDLRDVTWSNKTDLYFAAPGKTAPTGVVLAGDDGTETIGQYELYHNGVKGYYFVQTTNVGVGSYSPSAGRDPIDISGGTSDGTFYTLVQINTINGVPVYKAIVAETVAANVDYDEALRATRAGGGVCNVDLEYKYIGVSNLSTALLNKKISGGDEVFDVTDAKVVDVYWDNTKSYTKIDSVKGLNDAISGGYTNIEVAAVYDGAKVSTIYVTSVSNAIN